MVKHLHVIAFNVPYPADYGGVIDVFYRLKALYNEGVKIHLHCFEYGREGAKVLTDICEEVVYYKRSMSFINQFSKIPYIVKSRSNADLLNDLLKDDYPILFEGLHSCFYLNHPKLENRLKIVRCHNVEHDYYHSLAKNTPMGFLRLYFRLEARKLKRFEQVLNFANHITAISKSDEEYFQNHYGKTFITPPCHQSEEVNIAAGEGKYILYHGNLSVQENDEAARYIVEQIAPYVGYHFLIAGKNPMPMLQKEVYKADNVQLVSNPDEDQLQQLIYGAHINLLPTFQATGFKLKLLNALFNGRFCIGTPQLVVGTGLQDFCILASGDQQMIDNINEYMQKEFTPEMVQLRKDVLNSRFSNKASVQKIIALI